MTANEIKKFENITEEQLVDVVHWVCAQLHPHQIIFLEGEPGAGKTTLVNHILRHLNCPISASPTFALHHRTVVGESEDKAVSGSRERSGELVVDHFDLYRIEDLDELETTGIWEVLNESASLVMSASATPVMSASRRHLVFIEWANKFDSSIWPNELAQMWIQIIPGKDVLARDYQVILKHS